MENETVRMYAFVAKPFDLERHRFQLEITSEYGRLRPEWRGHLEGLAFQVALVRELLPRHRIIPLIVVPVTGLPCPSEGSHATVALAISQAVVSPGALAVAAGLLRIISVGKECAPLIAEVGPKMRRLEAFLADPTPPAIGYGCKKCEFRTADPVSGFEKCWGRLAAATMFDLSYMYFIQDPDGKPVADRLARAGTVTLSDIPKDRIQGKYAPRQHLQLAGTEYNKEIVLLELESELSEIIYPLKCLDIESLRSWLPAHRGEGVNALVLFQFSVHTRPAAAAPWEHAEWLNDEKSHPNKRFLAALRATLGDHGSVAVWTSYEETSFKELVTELAGQGDESDDFRWLRDFLGSGRIIDLHEICFRCYFHPLMKGRTSIKSVLPAIWSVDCPQKKSAPYYAFPADSDPYAVLKEAGETSDGCLAMQAYLDVIGNNPAASERARNSLLRYCFVDTLAMAFVYDFWLWHLDGRPSELPIPKANFPGQGSPGTQSDTTALCASTSAEVIEC